MRLILLLSALCLVCSCSIEQENIYGTPVPVLFTPSIAGETNMKVSTRVVNDKWSGTEVVGITSLAAGSSLASDAKFYKYASADTGKSVTLNPINEVLYFPVDGSNVDFIAFGPYSPNLVPNPVGPSEYVLSYYTEDQSTQEKMEEVDFIWAKSTGTHNKNNPTVNLEFTHQASKLIIKVVAGKGVTSTEMNTSTASLELNGVPIGGHYLLSTGEINTLYGTGEEVITPFKSASTDTTITWEAIVPPNFDGEYQTRFTNRKLKFTFNGINYTYNFSLEDNYESGKSYTYNLTLTKSGVVFESTTVSDWTTGEVTWNGGKYGLRTSSSEIILESGYYSYNGWIQYRGTDTAPAIKISTSATNSEAGVPDWLTTMIGDPTNKGDWKERSLHVQPSSNDGVITRTAYIHVTLEGLSVVIEVHQEGNYEAKDNLANCYIVSPGSTISIPLQRAYTYGGAAAGATLYTSQLWADQSSLLNSYSISGNGSSATLNVTANSNSGNALLAVHTGSNSGPIVWSYHIWVTGYFNSFTNIYNSNNSGTYFVFMDRNLGAIDTGIYANVRPGLFYQWGRKDPFPSTLEAGQSQAGGGTFRAVNNSESVGTIEYTIKNPNVFIRNIDDKMDWHFSYENKKLWGHGEFVKKTIFDPCPKGWRVPAFKNHKNNRPENIMSPWLNAGYLITTLSTGIQIYQNTDAFYPFIGYRQPELYNDGISGRTWSGSTNIVDGSTTRFGSMFGYTVSGGNGQVTINEGMPKIFGLPVRCVREE